MTGVSAAVGRLRPTWRVVLYLPAYFFASLVIQIPLFVAWVIVLALSGQTPPARLEDIPLIVQVLSAGASLVAALGITFAFRRFVDRRPFLDLGLRITKGLASEVIIGLALGLVLIAGVFFIELGAGWLAFDGFAWESRAISSLVTSLAGWFILFVCVAIYEELVFRGYVLQNLEYAWGPLVAALGSSVSFAVFHALNPGFGFLGWVGLIAAGLLLAYSYLLTRALWLPMAFHLAWNFAEGPLFSFPVSGLNTSGLLEVRPVGGDSLLTGGAFGPEGGLLGLLAVTLGGAILWAWGRGSAKSAAQQEIST
ncbi:MAG: CPBP family intramembrane metalloprotease [Chloroflexi bacterium]|nr:CPBP family intramembrane metalloprotease [Chloroflexota bacterium]